MPILSRMPARITEPAVGASTCASGSQVWKGTIGTLMANARKNAPKSQKPAPPGTFAERRMCSYWNEKFPVARPAL